MLHTREKVRKTCAGVARKWHVLHFTFSQKHDEPWKTVQTVYPGGPKIIDFGPISVGKTTYFGPLLGPLFRGLTAHMPEILHDARLGQSAPGRHGVSTCQNRVQKGVSNLDPSGVDTQEVMT